MRAPSLPVAVGAVIFLAFVYRTALEFRILNLSDGAAAAESSRDLPPALMVRPLPVVFRPVSHIGQTSQTPRIDERTQPAAKTVEAKASAHVATTTFPPLKVEPKEECVLSCCNPRSVHELAMEEEIARLLGERSSKHVVITLATNGTLDALRVHVASMIRNAPLSYKSVLIVCIGRDVFDICTKKWPGKCLDDVALSSKLREFSVDGKSRAMVVSRDYVDIVWRKPEICKLAFLAGAQGCVIVDSDGVWFRDPRPEESTAAKVVWSSSDFGEYTSRGVEGCNKAKQRSVTNSGTLWVPNNEVGNKILDIWLASRIKDPMGLCNPTLLQGDAMLDQDGLNLAVCQGPPGSMIYSSMQVLLNSVHAHVRSYAEYSICKPFFFHATNCGSTHEKAKCLVRNLGRWNDAGCGNFSAESWGLLEKPWP